MNEQFDLQDQVILISGGTSGVGREFILEALKRGAKVAFCWHHSEEKFQRLAALLEEFKGRWLGVRADISKEADVLRFFTTALEQFQKLDVVVSNAVVSRDSLLVSLPEETWDEIIQTNLTGAFLVCREAIKTFLNQQAPAKLLISGSLAQSGTPSNACYSASKGGLIGLMQYLARTYRTHKITTNMITFGLIDTELTRYYPEAAKQVLIRSSILKRCASSQEAAHLLLYFASPAGPPLNGQNFYATNGLEDFPIYHLDTKKG